jgi:hypothetical protein
LGKCPEVEITFWSCKFIIVCCNLINADKEYEESLWDNVSWEYDYINTMEDLYLYALLSLYYTYIIK